MLSAAGFLGFRGAFCVTLSMHPHLNDRWPYQTELLLEFSFLAMCWCPEDQT